MDTINPTTPGAFSGDSATLIPPFGHDLNRLHDTQRAAPHVGLSPATMEAERCRRRLHIPHFKIGRKVMYREADLVAFLDRCRVES